MAGVKTVSEIIEEVVPYYKKRAGMKKAGLIPSVSNAEHTLVYNSSSETLEPVYFFVLDLMNDFSLSTEKMIDNFTTSPGSGHFSEMGQKATLMQQQASKTLADIGLILRGVLNNIHDLKDFKIRLQSYDDFNSKDSKKSEAARLALKQIWLDKVDITKGNSSIAMMARQIGFQTLFDAFYVAKNEKDADKIDLNDRVKRVVKQRIVEFNIWLKHSESELRKRYNIQKTYLKSQVNNLKLYSRWAKPYLRAAQQLEMKEQGREPALVKAFNTILLELTLLGKLQLKPKDAAAAGDLPGEFEKMKIKRDYYSCILVDFRFRGIPQKTSPYQSHYVFGGKADVTFRAYSLNQDEIDKINGELDKSDLGDVLRLIEGTTTESLEHLQEEINEFLEDTEKENEKGKRDQSNPFLALIGHYNKSEKKENKVKKDVKKKVGELKKDNWAEKEFLRPLAAKSAEAIAFKLFDVYKKAHDMPSYT
ncbi:MAG: hypothetical protein ABIB79_04855 [archaeon]